MNPNTGEIRNFPDRETAVAAGFTVEVPLWMVPLLGPRATPKQIEQLQANADALAKGQAVESRGDLYSNRHARRAMRAEKRRMTKRSRRERQPA